MDADAVPEGRYLHTLLAPLMCPDDTQQLREGDRPIASRGTVRLGACPAYVRSPAQGEGVVVLQEYDELAQYAGAVAAGPAVEAEGLGRCGIGPDGVRLPVDAAAHRLEQPARVVEVALPQRCRSLAGQLVCGGGLRAVVGDDDAAGRRCSALGVPAGGARLGCWGGLVFGPVDRGCCRRRRGHDVLLVFERAVGTKSTSTRSRGSGEAAVRGRRPVSRYRAYDGLAGRAGRGYRSRVEAREEKSPRTSLEPCRASQSAFRRDDAEARDSHGPLLAGEPGPTCPFPVTQLTGRRPLPPYSS